MSFKVSADFKILLQLVITTVADLKMQFLRLIL